MQSAVGAWDACQQVSLERVDEDQTPRQLIDQSELQARAADCCLFGVRVVAAQIQGLRREGLPSAPAFPRIGSHFSKTTLQIKGFAVSGLVVEALVDLR